MSTCPKLMIVRASQAIYDDESKMLVLQSSSFTTQGLSETYLVAFPVFIIIRYFLLSSTSFQIDMWSASINLSAEPFMYFLLLYYGCLLHGAAITICHICCQPSIFFLMCTICSTMSGP
ncbi:unnamed protein product [Musa textilis]